LKYIVTKKFYDPFEQKRKYPNEIIDIPDKYLDGYKPYVRQINTSKVEEEVVIKEPKTKGRKKSGDK
jgi:hypothetical protein